MTTLPPRFHSLEEYTIVNGIIQNPGRYEGCAEWVPYFLTLALEGGGEDIYCDPSDDPADDAELSHTEFVVDSEEEERFGVAIGSTVCISLDGNGFAYGWIKD
jgi:hypothetical protein